MNVFDLAAILTLNSSQYDRALSEAQGKANEFGKGVKNVGKLMATGFAAGTAALSALSGMAVSSYADYEQLAGGIQKLYQGASDELMHYAKNAYQTSGLSANQYMEQATSFSAALVNSLGGDYSKAAKQTDVAMRAMSDNVNTFGTDMESVQNAFQGFAKQNYTMLDNLKLGYGGTKTEMQRLIDDANEYAKANGKAADLSIDSFSDIVTAIQYIQEEQHIAGTTAKEAATTISGAMGMAKSAWQNLLTGFADSEQDMVELSYNFVDSAFTAAKLIVPRFIEAFQGIVKAAPILFDGLKENIAEIAAPLVNNLAENLRANIGKLVDTGIKIATNIAQGIVKGMPAFMQYLPTVVANIASIIISNAPKILQAGLNIAMTLGKGIVDSIPVLIDNMPQVFDAVKESLASFDWASLGRLALRAVASGMRGVGSLMRSAAKGVATIAVKALSSAFQAAKQVGTQAMKTLAKAITGGISDVKSSAIKVAKSVLNGLKNGIKGVASIGFDIVRGIWNGISNGTGWIKSQITGWVGNVKTFLKHLFGISSPSKWARDVIGLNIAKGVAEGIEDGEDYVDSAFSEMVNLPSFGSTEGRDLFSQMKQVQMTNNITVDGAENPEEFADRFVRQLQMQMRMA